MSECCDKRLPPPSSTLERIFQKLDYAEPRVAEETEAQILSSLSAERRHYFQQLPVEKWPLKPNNMTSDTVETAQLKRYLGWALRENEFQKAVAAILCLEGSTTDPLDTSLLDDVMQHVEEKGPSDVIPPPLLVSWAKLLQIKGDLHGAIRRLNSAKALLLEYKSLFPCQCEAERIRGECMQLAGLTLNKMCCWKSAVQPLMESVDIFNTCAASEKSSEAIVVSMEMAAKCMCNITSGDYLELKEQLGFQNNDRFYQAYSMCKDSAGLAAATSPLMYIRAQNQAAESLLKYSAQQENMTSKYVYLQQVITEAQKSLQAHSSLSELARREQFFELVHSIFLVFLSLDFSDTPQDRVFCSRLEKQARFLYAEYCKQLSENDFQLDKIDLERCPDVKEIIHGLTEVFNLKLITNGPTNALSGKAKPKREQNGHGITEPGAFFSHRNHETANGNHDTKRVPEDKEQQAKTPALRHQEVGLPVKPEDFSIPVYDVPLTIFQDLCGCKFSGVQTSGENPQLSNGDGFLHGHSTANDISEYPASVLGITEDSGYGSSVALVDTFLPTKLPDSEVYSSQEQDSGVDSSFSSTDSNGSQSSEKSLTITTQPTLLTDSVKKARLLKFNPVTGIWSSHTTLVYVGQPLQLEEKLKGNCRDALHVQFLHQDEVLGRYVGKRYRRQRSPSQYLQDVTCQKTARFLVTLFNYALKDLRYDIQVVYVPVAHVQLLSHDGEQIEDWLNVEPYLEGDFIKLTNNLKFCNSQGRTLATALTHFTHSVSEGKLMLVDLQGWLPREGRGVVYLTDPQFHTNSPTSLSSCDMGQRGMQAFWESVHPECNSICKALGLTRPKAVHHCTQEVAECTRL